MQTLKIELVIVGAAVFALGAFAAMQRAGATQPLPEPVSTFTEEDFGAFDRNFVMDEKVCAVGLAAHRICLTPSPIESRLAIGLALEPDVPVLAAEFRVIVETDLKIETLRTVRFGRTLALIEPETREIRDIMRLDAASFALSRQPPMAP